ncbi:MAG: histidinol-phosphate transaminase [bacterium]|nr:histidinol-phosphate transaminase [bacterium]MDT8365723.1 histidinol-phosphate transaminase [bacterium]
MSELDLPRLLPEGLVRLTAYAPPEGSYPVRLDANECPHPPDPVILEEIRAALEDMPLHRYPDPASRDLRSAFATEFGCLLENVMAGNGSDELIGLLLWTLRGSQDQAPPVIVVPTPTFAMYSVAAQAAGYEVHEVPLGPGLAPDMEAMLRAIREKNPNIVFLSNPNNPTGTFYSREQVHSLLDVATGLVVVDEAYGDFSGEDSWITEIASFSNLAVLRTLSKVGAAAIRCGFLVAGRDLLDEVNKVRFPFNLSRYTQIAGEAVLRNYQRVLSRVADIVVERERLAVELESAGFAVFPSRGNFFLVQCGGREEALWRFLQDSGIVVKFLSRLPVAGDALRITVGMPEENDLLINRLKYFFAEGGTDA